MTGFVRTAIAMAIAIATLACAPDRNANTTASGAGSSPSAEASRPAVTEPFIAPADRAGLDFVHFNGMIGELYYPESMAGGVGLADIDNDGDLDVYLPQGHLLGPPGTKPERALRPLPEGHPSGDRLFRNELKTRADGSVELRFTDVTDASGITGPEYGMGVATGDIDNDGWVDLYVTNWGPDRLWRNQGDGTFKDITRSAGIDNLEWGTSAVFVDFDRDGWLDLYVANYVIYSYRLTQVCSSATGLDDYCGPLSYEPQADRLYRNRGNGKFEDISRRAGISTLSGNGLGVVTTDANSDGWLDLYVGNDSTANRLWVNNGDGTFVDGALLAGCALNRDGKPEGTMGVAAIDIDGDGDEDLVTSHIRQETNTLYVNRGTGTYDDHTVESGVGTASWSFTTYAALFLDYDNDSHPDLLHVNGAMTLNENETAARAGDPYPMNQPNRLLRGAGRGVFEDVTADAGPALAIEEAGRGAAIGDLDNDGDLDVIIVNSSQRVRLLINATGQDRPWLGLRLVGPSGRDMLGASAEVLLADETTIFRRVRSDGSYCSANDPRILIGLDGRAEVDRIRVTWPGGARESWPSPELLQYTTLRRGEGEAGDHR